MTPISTADVGNDDLQEIFELVDEGKYQQALEAHLDFFEQSRTSSGMGGVRLSFALSNWAELGSVYPPAKKALENIAHEHKRLLLAGDGNTYTTQAVNANCTVGKTEDRVLNREFKE